MIYKTYFLDQILNHKPEAERRADPACGSPTSLTVPKITKHQASTAQPIILRPILNRA